MWVKGESASPFLRKVMLSRFSMRLEMTLETMCLSLGVFLSVSSSMSTW